MQSFPSFRRTCKPRSLCRSLLVPRGWLKGFLSAARVTAAPQSVSSTRPGKGALCTLAGHGAPGKWKGGSGGREQVAGSVRGRLRKRRKGGAVSRSRDGEEQEVALSNSRWDRRRGTQGEESQPPQVPARTVIPPHSPARWLAVMACQQEEERIVPIGRARHGGRGSGRPCCPPGILSLAPSWVLGAGGLDHMAPQTMPEAPGGEGGALRGSRGQHKAGLGSHPRLPACSARDAQPPGGEGGVGSPAAVARHPRGPPHMPRPHRGHPGSRPRPGR